MSEEQAPFQHAKPTPGPWSFRWETSAQDWAIVTDSAGRIIANVNTETGPSPVSAPAMQVMPAEANARLIAAAPDMLEALEGLLAAKRDLDEHPDSDTSGRWERKLYAVQAAWDAARAAIAKARGGAA